MPLHGKGMLIVFSEVKARDERDFNEWYNREHIDERVNLPGFHRARRYVAVRGSPKYLAIYECDTVGDLATPGYLALLANQTPWTQAVMARFTQFNRMTLRVKVEQYNRLTSNDWASGEEEDKPVNGPNAGSRHRVGPIQKAGKRWLSLPSRKFAPG